MFTRKIFARTTVVITTAVLLLYSLWICCTRVSSSTGNTQALNHTSHAMSNASQPAATSVRAQTPSSVLSHYRVKAGDTFARALSSCAVQFSHTLLSGYRALKKMGMHCIHPGDSILVHTDTAGSVSRVEILSRKQCWYTFSVKKDSIHAKKEPLPVTRQRCIAKGKVNSSIYESMTSQGIHDALVFKFIDLFAWDVNFFLDCRKGDSFKILYEKKFIGERFAGYATIYAATYTSTKHNKTYQAFAYKPDNDSLAHFNGKGHSVQRRFLKSPLRFSRVSSQFSFNRAHPILGVVRPHLGIDYAAPRGTPVYAASEGTVIFKGRKGGYGKHIRIRHKGMYTTYYSHLSSYARGLTEGATVQQGDFIGRVGSTGLSTGPHLDYRVKRGRSFINPNNMVSPSKDSLDTHQRKRFRAVSGYYAMLLNSRFSDMHGEYVLDITMPSTVNDSPKISGRILHDSRS